MNTKFIGNNFDDFLLEEGLLAQVEATAIKRVITFQIGELLKEHSFSFSQKYSFATKTRRHNVLKNNE